MVAVLAGLFLVAGATAPVLPGAVFVFDRAGVPDTNPTRAVAPAQDTVPPATIDSLFRVGLDALSRFDEGVAMSAFGRIVELAPNSPRAPEAMFNAAYLYYRRYTRPAPDTGTAEQRTEWLNMTRQILGRLEKQYPLSRQAKYARTLHTRVCAALATRGDSTCADEVRQLADGVLRIEFQSRRADTTVSRKEPWNRPSTQAPRTAAERDSAICRSGDPDAVVAAISSVWKTDMTQAVRGVRFVMTLRQPCMAGLRERTILTMMDRQIESLVPLMLEVARDDPDQAVRRRATLWLSAQPPNPELARHLEELQRRAAESPAN